MDLKKEFFRALQVAKLDHKAMHSLASDESATGRAILLIVIASFAGAAGSLAFPVRYGPVVYRPTVFEAIGQATIGFILVLAALFLFHLIATHLFKKKGTFHPLVRVVGYGYVVGFLNFLPVLSLVVAIWMIVITIKALMEVKKLSAEQAVIAFILVAIVLFVLMGLIQGLNAANLYGGLYVAPY